MGGIPAGGIPARHVALVTSGPRGPQLLQQCVLTSSGPQLIAASNSTSGSAATATSAVAVPQLAVLSHALPGGSTAGTSAGGQAPPLALIAAAGPGQGATPGVMRMAAPVLPRQMTASTAMQQLTSAISLQQLQLSFAAAAAAAQQQHQQQVSDTAAQLSLFG